jgi:hypothetical protein
MSPGTTDPRRVNRVGLRSYWLLQRERNAGHEIVEIFVAAAVQDFTTLARTWGTTSSGVTARAETLIHASIEKLLVGAKSKADTLPKLTPSFWLPVN